MSDKHVRLTIEFDIDQEALDEHGISANDVLKHLVFKEDDVADGFRISTDIPGMSPVSNFFLCSGNVVSQEFIEDRSKVAGVNSRLDALRDFKENEESLKLAAEKQLQMKVDDLTSRIQALEPRIRELIATGNACLQSNIPLTGQAFGMREDYDTNQFFTNSWSHLVGFVGNPNSHIEFLGINGGGACGIYNFRTDGVNVFSVNERNPNDVITPSVGHMERFLNRFDTFESAFYAYVDKTIEKQKRSLSTQIKSASTRVAEAHSTDKSPLKATTPER